MAETLTELRSSSGPSAEREVGLSDLPGRFLSAYQPTWRDRLASFLMGDGRPSLAHETFVKGLTGTAGTGNPGIGLVDIAPLLGSAIAAQEAWHETGDPKAAALAFIPGRSPVARVGHGLKNRLVSSTSDWPYSPPVKQQRPFRADYPGGASSAGPERLRLDIDGRPLVARTVVGRRTVGGADEAITPEELDAGATAILGAPLKSLPEGSRRGGEVGEFTVGRGSAGPVRSIALLASLGAAARHRVLAHETGHLIDDVVGKTIGSDEFGDIRAIPQSGLQEELRRIYHDLNGPASRRGKETARRLQTGPEVYGYPGDEFPAEYMAEAFRAYLTDPNYIKTVAPKTAQRIRAYVNANPSLNRIIQFNSLLPAAAGGGIAGLSLATQERPD